MTPAASPLLLAKGAHPRSQTHSDPSVPDPHPYYEHTEKRRALRPGGLLHPMPKS
jgi:hypothetical protein